MQHFSILPRLFRNSIFRDVIRGLNPAPPGLLSERKPTEPGRPSSVGLRSDKRPSGPGFESLRLDFWAIPGRPPALSRRLDCTWTFFAGFYTTAASGSYIWCFQTPGLLSLPGFCRNA